MEIRETPEMWVLRYAQRLRISDVRHAADEYVPIIEKQIADHGLEADGPWIFISRNLPRDGKTLFDWEICRPVKKPAHCDETIRLHHLESIIVASRVHQGSLRSLFTKGYAPLVAEIEMSRHHFSGESREVYHGWNGHGSSYHNIEIQFGLSR
jgi:effector-binding domain-containing protein